MGADHIQVGLLHLHRGLFWVYMDADRIYMGLNRGKEGRFAIFLGPYDLEPGL